MRVLFLYDGMHGGISECAEYLYNSAKGTDLQIEKFATHGPMLKSLLAFPFRLLRFLMLLASGGFDVCHINVASRGSTLRKYVYSRLCKLCRVPYVLHLHGAHYREFYGHSSPFVKRRIEALFEDAIFVIVLGTVWKEFVARDIGIPQDRIEILQNAIDGPAEAIDNKPEGTVNIAFLGRLGPRKGIKELIEALGSSRLSGLSWRADICGDADQTPYTALANTLGISDKLTFHGWVGRPGVRKVLEKTHIFVLPSHAENLPLALLEAMAYGTCPVVTPVGAMAEVVHDEVNGLIVPVGDVDRLASALHKVLENPLDRQRMASRARQDFLANHEITAYRDKLSSLYARFL